MNKRNTLNSALLDNLLFLTLFRDGAFRGCSWMKGQKCPLLKICHRCPTMMKLGTVILYLKKIQKIHKSRDTTLEFY